MTGQNRPAAGPPSVEKVALSVSCESAYERLKTSPYSFFLDSALVSRKLGAFSFIGIEPFLVFSSKADRITLDWMTHKERLTGNPFRVLKRLFEQYKTPHDASLPFPFTGGGVGYFSYDLKHFNERLPDRAVDDIGIPDCIMGFYDCMVAYDHYSGEYFVISTGLPEKGRKGECRKRARLENLKNRLLYGAPSPPDNEGMRHAVPARLSSNFTKHSYMKAVEKAREYIKAGDIYQVNLSQRFKVALPMDPFGLYKIVRTINPAPFACYLDFGDVRIVSASPERFLKKNGRHIQTRPIKGTRPRGSTRAEDERLRRELIASVKDRAENLMIIDLERNDLGRICEYGSVRVTEFMTCEEYATVFHLVSTIEGRLRRSVDALDCLMYCFPGGSITGAPKIRSMGIIEELEPVKRSVYTGSVGYIGFDGAMDTSIVIRTFIVKGRDAYFQVGGGIVYDSDPEKEYQETLDKAKALIEAVTYSTKGQTYTLPKHEIRISSASSGSAQAKAFGGKSETKLNFQNHKRPSLKQ